MHITLKNSNFCFFGRFEISLKGKYIHLIWIILPTHIPNIRTKPLRPHIAVCFFTLIFTRTHILWSLLCIKRRFQVRLLAKFSFAAIVFFFFFCYLFQLNFFSANFGKLIWLYFLCRVEMLFREMYIASQNSNIFYIKNFCGLPKFTYPNLFFSREV